MLWLDPRRRLRLSFRLPPGMRRRTWRVVTHGTMCDPKEPGAVEVTKTMDEWARAMGPGYLCTTEFQED